MKKYEYKQIDFNTRGGNMEYELNLMGEKGWELVGVSEDVDRFRATAIMMREKVIKSKKGK